MVAAAGATPPGVTPTLTGTEGAGGWYRSAVTLRWDVGTDGLVSTTGCELATQVVDDTPGVVKRCVATYASGVTMTGEAKIKVDKTPPADVHAVPARAANANGWFAEPVRLDWTGTDTASGIAGCTSTTYSGPDGAATPLTGTCRDGAGNVSAPAAFALNYDATAPTVTGAAPARKPDHREWFLRPVAFAFQGQDAVSGIDACDVVTYAGPDHSVAPLGGGCRDRAGNAATGTVWLRYDGAAPALTGVRAIPGRRVIRVHWQASSDARHVVVTRSPGRHRQRSSVVYRGTRHSFVDRHVGRDVRYRYTLTAVDPHAKTATQNVETTFSMLLAPRRGARVEAPALLRWRAVRGAHYYNVQLFRGRHLVRTSWPARPRLRLAKLRAGDYRWYVWPGYGSRAERNYGRLVGHSRFSVG